VALPKSNLDWLGIVSLWVGAIIMAIKSADAPLVGGAPSWLSSGIWGHAPLVLITLYLAVALYRLLSPVSEPAPKPEAAEDGGKQLQRRQLIADGRNLVARFNRQTRHDGLIAFLSDKAGWHAIRPRLDPKILADLENGRLAVATRGDVKDGKVYYLMQELDRLEREWDLL